MTARTRQLIELIDDPAVRAEVTALFENDGALYGPPTAEVLEHVRFSVIKLAMQGPKMLQVAGELYRVDTRDLLVNAEFADDLTAHEKWCESMLVPNNSWRVLRSPLHRLPGPQTRGAGLTSIIHRVWDILDVD